MKFYDCSDGRVLSFFQKDTAFHMRRMGELIEKCGASDSVASREALEIADEGLGIAGDVDNIFKCGNQLTGRFVQTGPWRIDQNSPKIIFVNINSVESIEFPLFPESGCHLLGAQPDESDVFHFVESTVLFGCGDGVFADFGG